MEILHAFYQKFVLEMVDKRTHPSIHVGPENADDSKLRVSKDLKGNVFPSKQNSN